ncbi:MAG: LysR family transcriptional regulator [Boseongicola sp.]|nr:MAG: LysR family transcriptional regulator [Boseongicola sp.]
MNAPVSQQVPLLDLDLLKTLVAIADTGSFSAAGAVVFRTPSAISMQVKKIEEILERPVFIRDSRSVRLTADGAFLLEHARRMLALNRDAVARFVQPDVQGVVRMGAPDDLAERFLPVMLRRFADSHPGVTVNVTVDMSDRNVAKYLQGELDLTIITCDAGFEGDEEAETLYREPLVWAARKGGLAVEQTPLPVSVWEEGCVWRKAGIGGLDAQGRAWRIAFQSGNISGQRAAILADLAIAPLPKSSIGGDIIEAPAKYGLPALPKYSLGMLHGRNGNPAVSAAVDHLRASFSGAA